jgi:ribonuclease BN (tRNA processing enzyme)
MFRLRALGTGTIAFSPARSCSGYLIDCHHESPSGGEGSAFTRILMDCGSGITRRLAELGIEWQRITHIALTHFHIDHHADIPTLLFAFRYGMLPARSEPLTIIGPVGTRDLFDRLAAAYGEWVTAPGFPQVIEEIAPGESKDLGGAVIEAFKVPHTAESVAYSITRSGRRIVYTGDTGVSPELGVWAKGCDLLVAECSLPAAMAIPEHLTPEQAGELGQAAQPRLLALTHFYPPVERVDVESLVRRSYAGPLVLAQDGWVHDIEDR